MIGQSDIQSLLDQQTSAQLVPCIALGMITPASSKTWISGYRALIPQREALSGDTLFDLASLTKVVVTTTLILKLIEDGKIALDTKVNSILPDFRYPEITVLHLLTHTSGLCADHKGYKDHVGKSAMRAFVMDLPLSAAPMTQVIYSDFGFILLGFLIEEFLGPLDLAAKRLIFDPLGMKDTGFRPHDKARCAPSEDSAHRGLIRGVVHDGKAYNLGEVSGNAGLFSTLGDMMIFAQMMLEEDERVLKKSTKALLRQTYTGGLDHQRTLGWYRHDDSCFFGAAASQDILYHTGFSGTSLTIDYGKRVAIVILTNRIHPNRDNDRIQGLRLNIHDALYRTLQ